MKLMMRICGLPLLAIFLCAGIAAPTMAQTKPAAPKVRSELIVSTDWLARNLSNKKVFVLHVTRDQKAFEAGHIPGALNRPFGENLGSDGRFKSAAVLRAEFDALLAGRDPATVVHHCGSGVSAVPNVMAMELAGFAPVALYAGSWSEWCRDPTLPVEKG